MFLYFSSRILLRTNSNTVLFTKLAWPSGQRKKNFPVFEQLWLLLKQQANKQWVKALSTHSKLACWWVILYSEKNNNTKLVYFRTKKQKLLSQKNHWTDTIASAMLHRIKSFILKARCCGARPFALVYSL